MCIYTQYIHMYVCKHTDATINRFVFWPPCSLWTDQQHSENLDDYIRTDSYFLFFLSVAISKQIGTNRKIKLLTANCTWVNQEKRLANSLTTQAVKTQPCPCFFFNNVPNLLRPPPHTLTPLLMSPLFFHYPSSSSPPRSSRCTRVIGTQLL